MTEGLDYNDFGWVQFTDPEGVRLFVKKSEVFGIEEFGETTWLSLGNNSIQVQGTIFEVLDRLVS